MKVISVPRDIHVTRIGQVEETNTNDTQRDSHAFGFLYDQYAPRIYRYLLSRTNDIEVAKDLTSLTFLTAFEAFPRYREQGNSSAWLFSIARNKCVDHFRKSRKYQDLPTSISSDPNSDLLDHSMITERISNLRSLIQSLPEKDRELIRLRYVADLSFAEIATLFNKKEDTVKKNLHRLLSQLQNKLEEHHE